MRVQIIIYLLVIVFVVYLGYNFYQQDKAGEWKVRANELQSISHLKLNAINHWLQERFSDADYLFNNKPFIHVLQNSLYSQSDSDSVLVSDAISSIYHNHDYANIFILNAKFKLLVNLNTASEFQFLCDSLQSSIIAKKIVFSNIYIDSLFNKPVLDIYVPLFNENIYIASIVLKVDPAIIFYKILSSWDANDHSGESLIVTPFNDEVVFITPLKFLPFKNNFIYKSRKDTLLPAVKIINGKSGLVEGIDYRGVPVLAYVISLDALPWYLVSKIDLEEVYEPVSSDTFTNVLILLLIVFLGGTYLLFLHTRINFNHLKKVSDTERKFKSIFENSTNAIFLMDHVTFIDCNSSAEELLGVPKSKIIGKTPVDFSPEYQLNGKRTSDLVPALINQVLNNNPQRFEWIHNRNGKTIYADVALFSFSMNHKKYIVGFLWDITAYKLSEFATIESEDKYRNLVESIDEIVFACDEKTNLTFINSAVQRIAGYNVDDIIGHPFSTFLHPDDLSIAMNNFMNLSDNKINRSEYRLKTKDGNYRYFSATIHGIFAGSEFKGARGILMDITQKVLSAHQIKVLSKAVEQSPVSVVLTDLKGNIQFVNEKFSKVTGYKKDEVLNQNPRILKSGTQSSEFYKKLWDTILSGKVWQGELHNKRKNGQLYWENAIISPVIDDNGKITNFIAVKEDITEKKKMITALIETKEKAEEANKLKSIFLANMSHELRTPLVGILGFAELLLQDTNNPKQIEMSDIILNSGRRLLDTLNSILDISSIEADKQAVKISSINLNLLLKESLKLFQLAASAKSLHLKLIVPEDPVIIESDRDLLLKIMSNLISNAIKYTFEGSITIHLSKPFNGLLDTINIEIIDTGIGISKANHSIIFEPFRQISEGFSRKFDGSGLGLSITKKLVELLKGEITLVSELGKGSTFSVKLPVHSNLLSSSNDNKVSPEIIQNVNLPSLPQNLNILLVEDDFANAVIIKSYLEKYGSLHHAFDGLSAISLCEQITFDVILMDINLKGINGVETFNRIRILDEYYAQVPVVAITAYAMKGDRDKFLQFGFDDYLSKPFQPSDLIRLLSNLLNVH